MGLWYLFLSLSFIKWNEFLQVLSGVQHCNEHLSVNWKRFDSAKLKERFFFLPVLLSYPSFSILCFAYLVSVFLFFFSSASVYPSSLMHSAYHLSALGSKRVFLLEPVLTWKTRRRTSLAYLRLRFFLPQLLRNRYSRLTYYRHSYILRVLKKTIDYSY